MFIYLLIISLHDRGLQTFFPFISDLVELFTMVYFYFIFPFSFLSEEMPLFEKLEMNK